MDTKEKIKELSEKLEKMCAEYSEMENFVNPQHTKLLYINEVLEELVETYKKQAEHYDGLYRFVNGELKKRDEKLSLIKSFFKHTIGF